MESRTNVIVIVPLVIIILSLLSACSAEEEKPKALLRNVTVSAFVQDDRITPGSNLQYNMTLTNKGDAKDYDVAVEHRIFSAPLGRVIKTEGEIVKLDQAWVYKDKELQVPADAPTGDYQLIVYISYGENLSSESGSFFNVVKPVEEVVKDAPAPESNASTTPETLPAPVESSPIGSAVAVPPPPRAGKEVVIEHKGRQFVPDKVTIAPGTTVVWIQRDKTSGEVAGPGFSSGPLGVNKEFRHTFNKVGIFDFYSQLTKAGGSVIVDDPDNPTVRKRDPMSFQGGLDS